MCDRLNWGVDKTDALSTDNLLTATPRSTLNTRPNLHLRGTETQEAYLLQLHDHNCMKKSRHFFTDFLDPVHFHPISSSATNQNAVEYQSL